MKFTKVKANANMVGTSFQVLVIILFAFSVTIINARFDFSQLDYVKFFATFFITTYTKVVASNYVKNKLMKEAIVQQKLMCITTDKNKMYQKNLTERFKEKLKARNEKMRVNKIIEKLSLLECKKPEDEEKRKRVLKECHAFLKGEREDKVVYDIKFKRVQFTKLMTFGNGKSKKNDDDNYEFNFGKSFLNQTGVGMMISLVMSIVLSTIVINGKLSGFDVIFNLISYLISIALGFYFGMQTGEKMIMEDYMKVLESVASLIRELITEVELDIEEENKLVIEEPVVEFKPIAPFIEKSVEEPLETQIENNNIEEEPVVEPTVNYAILTE